MEFDPDKYLAQKSKDSGFDPDAYLSGEKTQQDKIKIDVAPGALGRSVGYRATPEQLNLLRSAMIKSSPAVLATLGELGGGPPGAYLGAMTGSAIKQIENPPSTMGSGAIEAGKDIAFNAAVPLVAGKYISKGLAKAGNAVYKSAFKVPDFIASQEGAAPLSSYFMENKPILSPSKMALETAKLQKLSGNEMRTALEQAIKNNAKPVLTEKALGPALNTAENLAENSFTQQGPGQTLKNQILNKWPYGTEIPLDEARRLSIQAGKEAQWAGRSAELPKSEVMQQARHGLEDEIVSSLSQTDPELANRYLNAKQAAETTYKVSPYLKKEIGKAVRKNSVTEVKGGLAGHALNEANKREGLNPFTLLGMYTAKAVNTPTGRTSLGNVLSSTAENPVYIDTLLRQVMNKSPWLDIYNQTQEEQNK